ncbi:MAG: hypothetical protein M3Y75_01475 [Actinomycetota bacterium]|nr:hypothetical protein [Actinomycetota bacterium]
MRVETELRLTVPQRKQLDENRGLRTERQIELYRKREEAKRERAERREVEARVRQLNLSVVQQAVFLLMGVVIGVAVVFGALGSPELLKLACGAAAAWGVIAGALYRWVSRGKASD